MRTEIVRELLLRRRRARVPWVYVVYHRHARDPNERIRRLDGPDPKQLSQLYGPGKTSRPAERGKKNDVTLARLRRTVFLVRLAEAC